MIKRKTFKIPAEIAVNKDAQGNVISRFITPQIDQITDEILSFNVLEQIWEDDVLYMTVECQYDDANEAALLAKWPEITP